MCHHAPLAVHDQRQVAPLQVGRHIHRVELDRHHTQGNILRIADAAGSKETRRQATASPNGKLARPPVAQGIGQVDAILVVGAQGTAAIGPGVGRDHGAVQVHDVDAAVLQIAHHPLQVVTHLAHLRIEGELGHALLPRPLRIAGRIVAVPGGDLDHQALARHHAGDADHLGKQPVDDAGGCPGLVGAAAHHVVKLTGPDALGRPPPQSGHEHQPGQCEGQGGSLHEGKPRGIRTRGHARAGEYL